MDIKDVFKERFLKEKDSAEARNNLLTVKEFLASTKIIPRTRVREKKYKLPIKAKSKKPEPEVKLGNSLKMMGVQLSDVYEEILSIKVLWMYRDKIHIFTILAKSKGRVCMKIVCPELNATYRTAHHVRGRKYVSIRGLDEAVREKIEAKIGGRFIQFKITPQ